MNKPRTFEHFPPEVKCPVCLTNRDGETVLLEVDGTDDGNVCEARPVHLWCAVANRVNDEIGLLYRRLPG